MSFSFNIKADSKAEALTNVKATLDGVVNGQPVHSNDRQYIEAATAACIGVLAEPRAGQTVSVSLSGSLGWRAENEFTSANLSVSVSLQNE